MLPDEVFLEILAFCVRRAAPNSFFLHMREWQRLVQVCRRWRQIIYASPHYLDLHLYCSNGPPVRENLHRWPAFPIAMKYRLYGDQNNVIFSLQQRDRIKSLDFEIQARTQWETVVATMQEPFPMLTCLKLSGYVNVPALPSGFLGGSAPSLQQVVLYYFPFPEFPMFLFSARNLVSLKLHHILPSPTGCISPEATIAALTELTTLETLSIVFSDSTSMPAQLEWRRRPDSPMRVMLPVLTYFDFRGCSKYLEVLVARIDAPRLNRLRLATALGPFDNSLDALQLPQLTQFIGCADDMNFRRAQLEYSHSEINIKPRVVDRPQFDPDEPDHNSPFSLYTKCGLFGTHITDMAHVLIQISTMFSNVDYVYIRAGDHPDWDDAIENSEWLAFFQLFTKVETLLVSGRLATQFSRALDDFPSEMVTEVLPSLHFLMLEDDDEPVSPLQFVSLRQLQGRPVTICDLRNEEVERL